MGKKKISRLGRFIKWLEKLNRTFDETKSVANSKSAVGRETVLVLSQFAGPILSSLIGTWIAQDLLGYNFPLLIALGFVVSFLFSTILQLRWLKLKLSAYKIFIGMLTILVVQMVALGFLITSRQSPVTYIIVDATENSIPQFSEIVNFINVASGMQSPNTRTGLRIFGGSRGENSDCDNTLQLISPALTPDYAIKLNEVLPSIEPRGNASLTIAVSQALREDLINYRGPIKLVVITSKLDPICDLQNSSIFTEIANEINNNSREEITIVILTIGELSEEEMATFTQYANAYRGIHINSLVPDSIPELILASTSYFSNYTSGQTTIPRP